MSLAIWTVKATMTPDTGTGMGLFLLISGELSSVHKEVMFDPIPGACGRCR